MQLEAKGGHFFYIKMLHAVLPEFWRFLWLQKDKPRGGGGKKLPPKQSSFPPWNVWHNSTKHCSYHWMKLLHVLPASFLLPHSPEWKRILSEKHLITAIVMIENFACKEMNISIFYTLDLHEAATYRCKSDTGPRAIPKAISSLCFWWLAKFCASLTWPLSKSISLCIETE